MALKLMREQKRYQLNSISNFNSTFLNPIKYDLLPLQLCMVSNTRPGLPIHLDAYLKSLVHVYLNDPQVFPGIRALKLRAKSQALDQRYSAFFIATY